MRSATYGLFATFISFFAFLLWWQWSNRSYPYVDAAHIFSITQEVFRTFQQEGLVKGLEFAYFHKHWRPVLFPVLTAGLLPFTGSIFFTLYLLSLLLLAGTCYFLFRFFRFMNSSWISVAGAFLVLYSTPMLMSVIYLATEMFFIFGALASYFYWLSSLGTLRSRRSLNLFCVFWAFATLCRPIESIAFGLPLFLFSTVKQWRRGQTGVGEIVEIGLLSAFCMGVIVFPMFILRNWTIGEIAIFAGIFILASMGFVFRRRRQLLQGFLIFLAPVMLWFLGGAWSLMNWLTTTSVSDYARNTGNSFGRMYLAYWTTTVDEIGLAATVIILGGLALFPWFKNLGPLSRGFVGVNFGFLLLNILLFSLSLNWEHRYCYPNYLALIMFSSYVLASGFVQARKKVVKVFVAGLAATATMAVAADFSIYLWQQMPLPQNTPSFGRASRPLKPKPAEGLYALAQKLEEQISEGSTSIGMLWNFDEVGREVNGWTVQMIMQDRGRNWSSMPYAFLDTVDTTREKFYRDNQYILVGPLESKLHYFGDSRRTFVYLKDSCGPRACKEPNLEFVSEFAIPSESGELFGYYLVKSKLFQNQVIFQ